jgi:hypothetical protein
MRDVVAKVITNFVKVVQGPVGFPLRAHGMQLAPPRFSPV